MEGRGEPGVDPVWRLFPAPPRDWQAEQLPVVWKGVREGVNGIGVYCTGAGKSWLLIALCAKVLQTLKRGYNIVLAVPSQDLVTQTAEDAAEILGDAVVGQWYGRTKQLRQVTVCCYRSMETLVDHMIVDGTRCALWIADEAHRASTERIMDQVERLAPVRRFGLTATPFRAADDEGLVGWDRIVGRYPIDQAIHDGVLVDFEPVPWDGEETDRDEAVVQMIEQHAPDGPGVVSSDSIEDAQEFAELLTCAGIPALEVHSELSETENRRRMAALRTGQLRCVVHVALLTEGVDYPWLRWLCMRRDTKSPVRIVQEAGRVLRQLDARRFAEDIRRYGPKHKAVLLLPHPTPVMRSMCKAYDELGGGEAAKVIREAAEDENRTTKEQADEFEQRVVAPLRSSGSVGLFVDGLLVAVAGSDVNFTVQAGSDARATMRDVMALERACEDRRRWGGRYLPSSHRFAVAAIARVPEALTSTQARSLAVMLQRLRSHAGVVARQREAQGISGKKKWWKGLGAGSLPSVPDDLTEFARHVEQQRKRGQR